jgi:hypothetical protein
MKTKTRIRAKDDYDGQFTINKIYIVESDSPIFQGEVAGNYYAGTLVEIRADNGKNTCIILPSDDFEIL